MSILELFFASRKITQVIWFDRMFSSGQPLRLLTWELQRTSNPFQFYLQAPRSNAHSGGVQESLILLRPSPFSLLCLVDKLVGLSATTQHDGRCVWEIASRFPTHNKTSKKDVKDDKAKILNRALEQFYFVGPGNSHAGIRGCRFIHLCFIGQRRLYWTGGVRGNFLSGHRAACIHAVRMASENLSRLQPDPTERGQSIAHGDL
jgi:hypothetical protein